MGSQHIIELNGRKYDAQTGKLLPDDAGAVVKSANHTIDGVMKKRAHAPRKVTATQTPPHAANKSRTLMRKAVKKPAHLAPGVTSQESVVTNFWQVKPQASAVAPSAERLNRADQVKRSKLINRYGADISAPTKPRHKPTSQAAHAAVASVSLPLEPIESQPEPDILDQASSQTAARLKKAPAHHRLARKLHLHPRTLSLSAAIMAFLLLGGFFAYNNLPNLTMRVAAARAQVKGTLPNYHPAGFALNGVIKYQPGEIQLQYKSNSDTRSYAITQKASSWDTDSLRENFVAGQGNNYQTVQAKGKTIYLYNDSNATWVDGGVWYNIDGQSSLNSDQVLRIANSL